MHADCKEIKPPEQMPYRAENAMMVPGVVIRWRQKSRIPQLSAANEIMLNL